MTIHTKKEMVELHGNEAQKAHFAKYSRFVSKRYEEGLLKTLNEIYEGAEIIKNPNGRGNVYKVGEKRRERAIREDGRISNGAWKIPYTKNLDIMVASNLEQVLENSTVQTLAGWARDFRVITEEMYNLLRSRYHEGLRKNLIADLKRNKVISADENRIVDDFLQITKELINQIADTFKRLKKVGIIEYYPVFKGYTSEKNEHINIAENVYREAVNLKRRLMEKYQVDEWYLATYKIAKKSIEFEKDFKQQLAQLKDKDGNILGLDYYYVAYSIILQKKEKKVIAYLEKYGQELIELFMQDEQKFLVENELQFHHKRKDYVVDKAQKKAEDWLDKTQPSKSDNLDLGGSPKKLKNRHRQYDFQYDNGYYDLYFNNLYAFRIKKLQEFYSNIYNFTDVPRLDEENSKNPFAPQNIELKYVDSEFPF